MKVYIIVMNNRLNDYKYIMEEAYTDLDKATKKCVSLNKKCAKSKDPFRRDDYYEVKRVEVKDE